MKNKISAGSNRCKACDSLLKDHEDKYCESCQNADREVTELTEDDVIIIEDFCKRVGVA